MPDTNDNDIDALRGFLSLSARNSYNTIASAVADRYHCALTALLAERDALKAQVLDLAFKLDGEQENRSALKRRVNELEDEQVESDRDLRERLLESVLGNVDVGGLRRIEVELMGKMAVWTVDAAIAAMRKGATDGK